MKTKNLLLAGLAVFAMTACNNDIESVDNNDLPLEKNASMQLNFSFPKTTRAVDAGSDFEYNASTVTAILEYSGTNKRLVVNGLVMGTPDANTGIVSATTAEFPVAAGTISKISVIINKPEGMEVTETSDLKKLAVTTTSYSLPEDGGLDYLRSTIAKNDEFLMSGVTNTAVTINAGEHKSSTIQVDRVSAKIEEATDNTKPYPLTFNNAVVSKDGSKISIKVIGHTYVNLVDNSYVFEDHSTDPLGGLIQGYTSVKGEGDYIWRGAETIYSLENITGVEANAWDDGKATTAIYKGQVYLGDTELTGHFYVKAKYEGNNAVRYLYKDWAELKAEYKAITIEEHEIDAEFLRKNAIQQYTGGVCYYRAPILTDGRKADIVRNNWYQLSVNSIKDLGTPNPAPEDKVEESFLTLNVEIMPWTIQGNSFDLE